MTTEYWHRPVMVDEVLRYLDPQPGEVALDCTLGGAGHAAELARRVGETGLLIGIDRDPQATAVAEERLSGTPHLILRGGFAEMDRLLTEAAVPGVDCVLFDFGVSSPQLDRAERGFSYHREAPLDMRMDSEAPLTAADLVNGLSERELAEVLRRYGDERHGSAIARAIVRHRPLATTTELADIVSAAYPAKERRKGHPARKTFQALRIRVNDELGQVERGLESAVRWLNPGGRVVCISYHSLEDAIVKRTFGELSRGCVCPPDLPVCVCGHVPILDVMTKRPVRATGAEVAENPRARSALLRAAARRPRMGTRTTAASG